MRKHVSWRAGGACDRAYLPADLDDLRRFLRGLPQDEPVFFVGPGQQSAGARRRPARHRDVHARCLASVSCSKNSAGTAEIYAEAGVASPKVARFAAVHDLEGGGVSRRHSRHRRRRAGDECRLLRGGDLGRRSRACARSTAPADCRSASRMNSLSAIASVHSALPPLDEFFVAAWFRFRTGDGEGAPQDDQGFAVTPHRQPAARRTQCRLGVPQSAGRSRGAADRSLRTQGQAHRRRGGFDASMPISSSTTANATARDIEELIRARYGAAKTGIELERKCGSSART